MAPLSPAQLRRSRKRGRPTPRPQRRQSLRHIDEQQDQQDAVDDVLVILQAAHGLRQQVDDDGPDHRALDRADAADIEHGEAEDHHVHARTLPG